ncbi:MAG: ABC transporter permease [Microthrixaceae bacterium]
MLLAWKDLIVARGRFVLVGLVVTLVALLSTLLSGLANGLVDDGISGMRELPFTHLSFAPGSQVSFSRSTLTDANLRPWKSLRGASVSPVGLSFVNAKRSDGSSVDLAVMGVPDDSFLITHPEGRRALAGRPGIVLTHELKAKGIKVGDRLTLRGTDTSLPVLGFTYAGSYGHVDLAFTRLDTWQSITYGSNAKGRFSAIAIRDDTLTASTLARIDHRADTETATKTEAYAGSPGYTAETTTMSTIKSFLLVISALIVGSFFTIWTVQRTDQIGLLKALGASNGYVLRDSLGQLAIVLTAGTSMGVAVAVGLSTLVGADVPFHLSAAPVATTALTLLAVGMAGSLIAIRRITRVDPAIALTAAI